ncbi:hypothetical protein Z517_02211 [Fonsecaea pedrosoi CBS 271.37]|uniref:Protein kinase domain-containing protein n=1 Tax=Fonsecaea pedrosoi CBS 271.37 TaxID=1442368 RepID=A0A0D2GPS1_9EURO|nr:uncharacterized protein Z517_02211 [Fonsecaea pedrosoi CBS 271.37]KIW82968.1 hypothetical protein Z517_02211 [Fonsecaea pedrosoi CBS 271.37]
MALMDGSVDDLIGQGVFEPNANRRLSDTVLHHVLMGIDYLSSKGIVHRDLKPANILFTKNSETDFHFLIADFGVSNFASNAMTLVGSPRYAAPEVLCSDGSLQTSKADIWSLFVTMAHVLNVDGYRAKEFRTTAEIIQSACDAAKCQELSTIKDMAIVEPEKRASAAKMLQSLYGDTGLATPLGHVDEPTEDPDQDHVSSPVPSTTGPARGKKEKGKGKERRV